MSESKSLSLPEVQHVANLARLWLDDAHLRRLGGQLESILKYVDQMEKVDVSGVEPMAHALPLHNVLREDIVEPSLTTEQVLANAPDRDGSFFRVPKILGAEEDSAG